MPSTDSPQNPSLSIIIVNYNGGQEFLACLESLSCVRAELDFQVIAVDNASTDDSFNEAEKNFPKFLFIKNSKNLGFAAACNVGLAKASGRHFMLLNPDTLVQTGALTKLVSALDLHPNWGIVGPRMVDQLGNIYPAARRFPTPFRLFCESTRLSFLFPHSKLFAGYLYGDRDLATLDDVEQVEGSALVISRAARSQVGDLDPRFFIFFEEVDWCKRVRDAGFEIHLVHDATISHFRSTTMSKSFLAVRQIHAQSCMKFFRKHHGVRGYRSLRRTMICALWIRQTGMGIASLFSSDGRAALRAFAARAERAVYQKGLPE